MSLMTNVRSNPVLDGKSMDLVICIDRSESMGYGHGQSKLTLAKDLASEIIRNLSAQDTVAIVAFDNVARISLPLTPTSQLQNLEAIMSSISERGNTCLSSGLKTSLEAFKSTARLKRAIILSDGRTNLSFDGSGGFEGSTSLELELREDSLNLEQIGVRAITVAIGTDAFTLPLKVISDATKGRLIPTSVEKIQELVTALHSDTLSLPLSVKTPKLEKNEMDVASFPSELPAGQPTWSLESIYEHVAIVSEEIASVYSNVGEALIINSSNQRFAKTALMSIETEILKTYRERLPKTTRRVRAGEAILLDKSYRLELELEEDSVVDIKV
ncbi:MAG: Ca-activated chloride channel [Thermoproteota archaeon]|nr:Ca-activated chloride channel [Thermoproteota archaeon]